MKPNSNEPIDKRLVVSSVDDLILESTWLNENGDNVAYAGMMVGVEDGKAYILKSLPVTNFSNWERLVSYSIGDTVITETNVNPSADLGGTWELYNKGFKSSYIYNTYTEGDITLTVSTTYSESNVNILIAIITSVQKTYDTDASVIISTNIQDLGISKLRNYGILKLFDRVENTLPILFSEYGQVQTYNNGLVYLKAGSIYRGNFTVSSAANTMLDDFCDKFYWRRIA